MQGREASGALLVVLLRGFLPSSSIPTSAASPLPTTAPMSCLSQSRPAPLSASPQVTV